MSSFQNINDSFTPLNTDSEDHIIDVDPILVNDNLVQLLDIEEKEKEREKEKNEPINTPKPRTKSCSIELCRIFAGFLVICCHLVSHGLGGVPHFPHNSLFLLNNLSLTCNSLFISISSFFLCDSRFSITRIVRFWIVTVINLYYANFLMERLKIAPFTKQDEYNCWFWFQIGDIWYSTGHMTFIFIMPLISKIADRIGKRSHLILVLFLTYTTSIGNAKPNGSRLSIGYNIDLFIVIAMFTSFYKKYLYEKSILWGFPIFYVLYTSQIRYIRGQLKLYFTNYVCVKTFFNGFFFHSISGTCQIFMSFCIFHILSHINVPSFLYYPLTFIGKTVYGSYVIGDNYKIRRRIYKLIKIKELVKPNNMVKPILFNAGKLYIRYIFLSGLLNIPLDLLIFDRDYFKKFARKIDDFLY